VGYSIQSWQRFSRLLVCLAEAGRHPKFEMTRPYHILVTGAGGFIGSHVTEPLLQEGHQVRALARYNGRGDIGHLRHLPQNLRAGLEVRLGDITDPFLVLDLVAGCDIVLHLAAPDWHPVFILRSGLVSCDDAGGTLNVLEACRQAETSWVIVTSTRRSLWSTHPSTRSIRYRASRANRRARLPPTSSQRLTIEALTCR
jgi:nucleoside-diphosphate-sugar epimerase